MTKGDQVPIVWVIKCPSWVIKDDQVPNVGDQVPNVSDQVPNVSDQVPNVSDQVPNVGDQVPNVAGPSGHWGDQVPNVRDQVANMGDEVPNVGDEVPNVAWSSVWSSAQRRPKHTHRSLTLASFAPTHDLQKIFGGGQNKPAVFFPQRGRIGAFFNIK